MSTLSRSALEAADKPIPLSRTYWYGVIQKARKRGRFLEKHRQQAKNWVTCACGKVSKLVPRAGAIGGYAEQFSVRFGNFREPFAPLDAQLFELGSDFYNHGVANNDFDRAMETLRAIEARAAEVVEEGLKKKAAPNLITFKVEQRHIDEGRIGAAFRCPIALALREKGYADPAVGVRYVAGVAPGNIPQPPDLAAWRQEFDSGSGRSIPATFTLDLRTAIK